MTYLPLVRGRKGPTCQTTVKCFFLDTSSMASSSSSLSSRVLWWNDRKLSNCGHNVMTQHHTLSRAYVYYICTIIRYGWILGSAYWQFPKQIRKQSQYCGVQYLGQPCINSPWQQQVAPESRGMPWDRASDDIRCRRKKKKTPLALKGLPEEQTEKFKE